MRAKWLLGLAPPRRARRVDSYLKLEERAGLFARRLERGAPGSPAICAAGRADRCCGFCVLEPMVLALLLNMSHAKAE